MSGFFGFGNSAGLEVSQGALRAVGLKKSKGGLTLERHGEVVLPAGLLMDSFTEPNITDMPAFVDSLKRLMSDVRHRGKNVCVAVPDYVARVSVLDFESYQSKKDETERMIRWRLKKIIPFDLDQAELRYQYLGRFSVKDKQQHRFLVSIIKSEIMAQYETAFNEARLRPLSIAISSFAIWNLYHDQVLSGDGNTGDFAMMNIFGGRMTVMVFNKGLLHFFRFKDLGKLETQAGQERSLNIPAVLRELTASLTFYRENYADSPVGRVYISGDFEGLEGLAEEVGRNLPLSASLLDLGKVVQGGPGGLALSAACGAAIGC